MSVRAKFKVESVTKFDNGNSVKLSPVTSGSEENESFFHYTPFGTIEIGTINENAAADFTPGAEFYVDFTKA
ncbi:hypothetical protein BKP64_10895 [Marinobacter salinus]|uniref:Uncharacterized protein n=1 Tax=Marinobacter salinus TaxID=1874317 RepID=A0A1D9GMA2_9GAMM|nr:hypothetical protein [Marinobacter salinus]AOY88635.1 hypothetical protein BKP64_10895 [Marinobacter salinus]